MALPSTNDGNVRFIEDIPEWSAPISVGSEWSTEIIRHRDQSEQRVRRQKTPKWSIQYELGSITAAEFALRRSRQFRELEQLTVAPLWPLEMPFPDTVAADSMDWFSFGGAEHAEAVGFKVGSYAFFAQDGLTSVFRKIAGISTPSGTNLRITFVTGNAAYPVIAVPAYTGLVKVRPCVAGTRSDSTGRFGQSRVGFYGEQVLIEEI